MAPQRRNCVAVPPLLRGDSGHLRHTSIQAQFTSQKSQRNFENQRPQSTPRVVAGAVLQYPHLDSSIMNYTTTTSSLGKFCHCHCLVLLLMLQKLDLQYWPQWQYTEPYHHFSHHTIPSKEPIRSKKCLIRFGVLPSGPIWKIQFLRHNVELNIPTCSLLHIIKISWKCSYPCLQYIHLIILMFCRVFGLHYHIKRNQLLSLHSGFNTVWSNK